MKSVRGCLAKLATRLIKDERGQSTTEYVLILAVVVMVALRFKDVFEKRLTSAVDKLGGKIDDAVGSIE